MQNCIPLLTAFAVIMFGFSARAQVSVGVLGHATIPNDGLRYGNGLGIRAGLQVRHVYFGMAMVFYGGDHASTHYEARPGIPETLVSFETNPVLLAHDIGYKATIPIAGKKTFLTPYASYGLMNFFVSSDQPHGRHAHLKMASKLGCGLMYRVPLTPHLSAALHYRWYPYADKHFEFGTSDADLMTYGFSSAIGYSSFGLELAYQFRSSDR